jgi:hypothetical protein
MSVVGNTLRIGYAAMLEQFPPMEPVGLAAYAEQRGFSGVMAADHFPALRAPTGPVLSRLDVLAAVAGRTRGSIGPGVTAATFRWHPAMVAQASTSLAAMYHRHRRSRPKGARRPADTLDARGRSLSVTQTAIGDEIAGLTDLVKRKADGIPVAVVRGLAEHVGTKMPHQLGPSSGTRRVICFA